MAMRIGDHASKQLRDLKKLKIQNIKAEKKRSALEADRTR